MIESYAGRQARRLEAWRHGRLSAGSAPSPISPVRGVAPLIRGKALIFWDPKDPAKKLDAIDTDQITPAADCVSESLDTLDERWKAGSFRYLMPDFRARVHRGETFVIAGDRFAIGSSREMSPAGLKAIAEEVGLEMVIICGDNMGDIFRRNAFNLGLHVVQSPEAVADARDGDEFTFDPVSRADRQRHAGQDLHAGAAQRRRKTRSARAAASSRSAGASSASSVAARRRDRVSRSRIARARMSTTEQIVWAHRVDKDAEVAPGATLRVYADLLPASDGTAPFCDPHLQPDHRRQHDLSAAGGGRQRSLRLHRQGRRRQADGHRPAVRGVPRHREAVLRDAGRRHLPFLFSRAGPRAAGPVHSRRRLAQPRLRRVRRGRHGRRLDDARLRLVDRLHLLHDGASSAASRFTRPAAARGSPARTSSSSCCAAGARSSRRACRWSSSTPTSSCRSRFATPSPT